MKTSTKLVIAAIVFVIFASRKARASPRGSKAVMFTDDNIKGIDARVRQNFASVLIPAMEEGDIVTLPRIAAFLAQILHESGGFVFLKELASGKAYEGRKDLGNTQPGDGPLFKGRGFIMLTGRANYREAGADLNFPLESNPDLAADPAVAARTAVWFWTKKKLNAKADAGDFVGITRAINGGLTHLTERQRLYENAKRVLGSSLPPSV